MHGEAMLPFAGFPSIHTARLCLALLFEKKQKEPVLFFGAKKRTKRSIHPLQGLPLYGEDVIDYGQRPPYVKVLVWLAKPVP